MRPAGKALATLGMSRQLGGVFGVAICAAARVGLALIGVVAGLVIPAAVG